MTDFLHRRATFWSVVALSLLLFAITNLPWHLDDYDQAKQAFTSFEMMRVGHWFYQHTPNWWVATKPPFIGWISAAFFYVSGSWDLAWRLPSFLAALASLALIARAAGIYGRLAALMATAAFGLNLFTPRLATLVRTDMPLVLVMFVIGWLIWEKIRRREMWRTRDRLVLFLLLSVTMLIKGPIVCAFLLPGIVVFQWWARSTGQTATAWFGWWPWLASLAIFVVWVTGGVLRVPEFLEHVAMREFAGRFDAAMHRPQPLYFYLPHLLHRFAPWSILLFLLSMMGAKEQQLGVRHWWRSLAPETFWLIAWSFGGLLVMSLIPSKRVDRIFPIVPPLCLLLAAAVGACWQSERLRRFTETSCAIAIAVACLFTAGYAARRIASGYRQHSDAFATFGAAVRKEAAAHGWRYAVVGGRDEGMLLYVRQTEFLRPYEAAAQWNRGMLDGLVVSDDELNDLLPRLRGAVPSNIPMSRPAGNYRKRYVFLVRS